MTENLTLTIDGQEVSVGQGKTLLDAARDNGKDVPTICYHDATTANGLCRICVVEVEGMRVLQPACIVQVGEGMKVQTRSEKVIPSGPESINVDANSPNSINTISIQFNFRNNVIIRVNLHMQSIVL